MKKYCVRRDARNHKEVNEFFTKLYNKKAPYTGTGVTHMSDKNYMCYPPNISFKHSIGAVVNNYIPMDYQEVTLEQLKQIIMSEKKYTQQDWIDFKCAILMDESQLYHINSFLGECNSTNNKISDSHGCRYLISPHKDGRWQMRNSTNLPVVEIKDIVLNTLLDKTELIGYRLKPEFYQYEKAVVFIIDGALYNGYHKDIVIRIDGMSTTVQKLKDANIMDWFEEVREQKRPQLPMINGYKGEDTGDYIKYGCAHLPKVWFTSSINRSIITMQLSSGKVIRKDEIELIQKYLQHDIE